MHHRLDFQCLHGRIFRLAVTSCAVAGLSELSIATRKRRTPVRPEERKGGSGARLARHALKIAIVLDAGDILDCIGGKMKMKIFAAFAGITIVTAGCVSTVTDTHTAAVSFAQDRVEGRYQRPVDQVYQASVQVIQHNGTVITEYIPHDTTNTVRSLLGKVNQCDVWLRVEAVDPQITEVAVQARTTWGGSNIDLAHELEKEIALQLAR
jgi:hypothetical protein